MSSSIAQSRPLRLYRVMVLVSDPHGTSYAHRRIVEEHATSPKEAEAQVLRRIPTGKVEGRTR